MPGACRVNWQSLLSCRRALRRWGVGPDQPGGQYHWFCGGTQDEVIGVDSRAGRLSGSEPSPRAGVAGIVSPHTDCLRHQNNLRQAWAAMHKTAGTQCQKGVPSASQGVLPANSPPHRMVAPVGCINPLIPNMPIKRSGHAGNSSSGAGGSRGGVRCWQQRCPCRFKPAQPDCVFWE